MEAAVAKHRNLFAFLFVFFFFQLFLKSFSIVCKLLRSTEETDAKDALISSTVLTLTLTLSAKLSIGL